MNMSIIKQASEISISSIMKHLNRVWFMHRTYEIANKMLALNVETYDLKLGNIKIASELSIKAEFEVTRYEVVLVNKSMAVKFVPRAVLDNLYTAGNVIVIIHIINRITEDKNSWTRDAEYNDRLVAAGMDLSKHYDITDRTTCRLADAVNLIRDSVRRGIV